MSAEDQPLAGTEEQKPLLRVVSPNATPEEIAALVAVFAAMGGGQAPAPRKRSEWASPRRQMRGPHLPGPGGWTAAVQPR